MRQQLWPDDTFVDFDHGLNNAVNRLREALGDSAASPQYIETLPRRGYRLISPTANQPAQPADHRHGRLSSMVLIAAFVLLPLFSVVAYQALQRSAGTPVRAQSNPEAYQLYLRGRSAARSSPLVNQQAARDYFNRALQRGPNSPDTLVALAQTYALSDPEVARILASRALELDRTLGEPHTIIGVVMFSTDWDVAGAEREFRRALALTPNSAVSHDWYGVFLAEIGRVDEGMRELRTASLLDPSSLEIRSDLGLALYLGRRYDDAITQLHFALAHRHLMRVYAARDQISEYLFSFPKTSTWFGLSRGEMESATQHLRLAFDSGGTRRFWEEMIQFERLRQGHNHILGLARAYAHLGDRDRCMAVLDAGSQQRDSALALWVARDPEFDTVRSDPRYQSLLRKIGLPRDVAGPSARKTPPAPGRSPSS
jgi:tetratricopeptide (TPR) repeat protein